MLELDLEIVFVYFLSMTRRFLACNKKRRGLSDSLSQFCFNFLVSLIVLRLF